MQRSLHNWQGWVWNCGKLMVIHEGLLDKKTPLIDQIQMLKILIYISDNLHDLPIIFQVMYIYQKMENMAAIHPQLIIQNSKMCYGMVCYPLSYTNLEDLSGRHSLMPSLEHHMILYGRHIFTNHQTRPRSEFLQVTWIINFHSIFNITFNCMVILWTKSQFMKNINLFEN